MTHTPCLQWTFVVHIAMKQKNASTIQYTMHKRTSTNKDNRFGGRSIPSTGKSFKTNINVNSKQHERNSVVFEETSHPPQWRPTLLASTNKALAIVHTLKERLGENKELARTPTDELLTLVQNKLARKKTTSSQLGSLDGWDLACWQDQ